MCFTHILPFDPGTTRAHLRQGHDMSRLHVAKQRDVAVDVPGERRSLRENVILLGKKNIFYWTNTGKPMKMGLITAITCFFTT